MRHTRRQVVMGIASVVISGAGIRQAAATTIPAPVGTPYAPEIDPASFGTVIDNQYFPLVPGTVFHYEGESDGETETTTVAVLADTREVMGVTCVVVRDTVSVEGEVVEDTLDWYAQDLAGNVWYMGEESKDYEEGELVSTEGSWEAGVDGAQPGIIMLADPKVGDSYRQEFYRGEAEDQATVVALDESVTVPHGAFENVLVTEDINPLEPDVVERKYYAPGIGLVFEEKVQGREEHLELVGIDVDTPVDGDVDDDDEQKDEDEPGDKDEGDEEDDDY